MYPVIQVTQPADAPEQLGTKKKFWYTAADGRRMLFKAEERGYGEDWSEKVVCEIAALMGIPHVHYELARDTATNEPGVVSAQLLSPGQQLAHGNTLLQAIDPSYPKATLRVPSHTVEAVHRVARVLFKPEDRWCDGLPPGVAFGADVFAGYLMLDALVANQDRHHENWAAVWSESELTLAPTYDHGAALARNVSDEDKVARLRTADQGYSVAAFAKRARSRLFASPSDTRPLTALAAFQAFAALVEPVAVLWTRRLAQVDEAAFGAILAEVPPDRLSSIGRDFTLQLLLENQRTLLAGERD